MTTKINPSEISSIIKKKIDDYKGAATEANVGEVLSTADGIVQIYGLEDAMYGELVTWKKDDIDVFLSNPITDNMVSVLSRIHDCLDIVWESQPCSALALDSTGILDAWLQKQAKTDQGFFNLFSM